jgi:prepilin-type N-terminal cleavage/methylation domain-containing protein
MTHGDEDGFTLLELVFAMVLLSIGVAALIGVLATSFRTTAVDVHRTDAVAIAAQGLAELEAAPVTGPLPSVTRNGQSFTLTGTANNATASNGTANAYPAVAVTVAWTDAAGSHSLTQSTATFTSPPTTGGTCTPLGPVNLVASAPPGDPSVDVSWQEPTGGPVTRWQVQISPDGTTWTTPIADEQPVAVGLTHQLEIGGLAPKAPYQVHVVATTACGVLPPFAATAGSTPSVASSACAVGSMTLGPATADRITTGAAAGMLTTDITVVVTTPGACASALLVTADTGQGLVTTVLTPTGSYSYVGTLPGVTQQWNLGVHNVEVRPGGVPPAVATGVLCVEQQGAVATC